jgi:poly(A) polymerase
VIIPPDEIWEPIQQIRKQNDKAYERWYSMNFKNIVHLIVRMPHINLLFPFIIPENFQFAAETASKALSVIEPFEMLFDCVNHFSHGKSSVLWLHPSV